MKTKPQTVRLKLPWSWSAMPFVTDTNPDWLQYGKEENARHFSRNRAAQILRRCRTWGKSYRFDVVK